MIVDIIVSFLLYFLLVGCICFVFVVFVVLVMTYTCKKIFPLSAEGQREVTKGGYIVTNSREHHGTVALAIFFTALTWAVKRLVACICYVCMLVGSWLICICGICVVCGGIDLCLPLKG